MLTLETLMSDYSLVGPENSKSYIKTQMFDGLGGECDVYFGSEKGKVKEEQIATYNFFKDGYKKYITEIDLYIQSSFDKSEQKRAAKINDTALRFDVIDIPFENEKYDLLLLCGKSYNGFLGLRNEISVRIEIKSGNITLIQREKQRLF
ncbi:hypothetical protein [uncultured Fluviicola sp.]|uniref:hypothetical protein n=1 Tax=uncultured Fluviicola sp. TaxID=463303 RepID=UPI0025E91758|nr:hypothetical protein [uncultured Fluviicola sp.]